MKGIRKMKDVLSIYERNYNSERPVVCADEKPVLFQGDIRAPTPCKQGSILKRDSEYSCHGSGNVFLCCEA